MDKFKQEKNVQTLILNFFLIREVYRCLTTIQEMPRAMERFYEYLETTESTYDKLIKTDYKYYQTMAEKLVQAGLSYTLFRSDSPTAMKASKDIKDHATQYLMIRSKDDGSLKDFQQFLEMHIEAVIDKDNALMVLKIYQLISYIRENSSDIDKMQDFLLMTEESEPQKEQIDKIEKIVSAYKNKRNIQEEHRKILSINFFLIREVYRCLTSIQKMPKAMEYFYTYLETTDDTYHNLTRSFDGNGEKIVDKFIQAGLSYKLFRLDSPAKIVTPYYIEDRIYKFLDKDSNDTLKDIRQLIKENLEKIYDADDILLAVKIFQLIVYIRDNASDIDKINYYIPLMNESDIEVLKHKTQTEQIARIKQIVSFYENHIIYEEE